MEDAQGRSRRSRGGADAGKPPDDQRQRQGQHQHDADGRLMRRGDALPEIPRIAAGTHGLQGHHRQSGGTAGSQRQKQQQKDPAAGKIRRGHQGKGADEQHGDTDHGKRAHMTVLQDPLTLRQIPPGQDGVAAVHESVQMDEAGEQIGQECQKETSEEAQAADQADQPGQQSPDTPDEQPDEGKAGQHGRTFFIVPPGIGTGNGAEHAPCHEKRDRTFHTGSSPLYRFRVPETISATVSQVRAKARST